MPDLVIGPPHCKLNVLAAVRIGASQGTNKSAIKAFFSETHFEKRAPAETRS